MQKIRLWEISTDQELTEIESTPIPLEKQLEDWLKEDISVLDPDLLVIGSQVSTDFGGKIDLLCIDSAGDTVVIELKKGMPPTRGNRPSPGLRFLGEGPFRDELLERANSYLESRGLPPLEEAFSAKFETPLPDVLNDNHRSLVVAEEIDASTKRIVRYLSDMRVPINVATVQHFRDKDGREILAQVYLIEPDVAEARSRSASRRRSTTLTELQAEAEKNRIGGMFGRMREGTRDILLARPYFQRIWYGARLEDGGQRALLIVYSVPDEEHQGMPFTLHVTRFNNYLKVSKEQLQEWLPDNTEKRDVNHWAGSSPEERESAEGLGGYFHSVEEVEKFPGRTQEQGAGLG